MDYPFEPHVYDLWMPNLRHLQIGWMDLTRSEAKSGIYFLCESIGVTYIGKSMQGYKRVTEHAKPPFDYFFWIPLPGRFLDEFESNAIKAFCPQFNQKHRDYKKKNQDDVRLLPHFLKKMKYSSLKIEEPIQRIQIDEPDSEIVCWDEVRKHDIRYSY